MADIYDLLRREATRRFSQQTRDDQNMMVELYRGKLPAGYEQYFPRNVPKHIIHFIKNAWNDLAGEIGQFPELRAEPLDETQREKRAAQKLERIGNSYLRNAEPSGKLFMWLLAWWILGVGRAVALVVPDQKNKRPQFTLRDPRFCLPSMRMVGNVPVELYDLLFDYELPVMEAAALGLARDDTNKAIDYKVKIIEFIDDKQHILTSEQGFTIHNEHNYGKVPGWVFQSFSPSDMDAGMSLFKDQVSLMVATSLLMTLKLAATDRQVNPIYWVKGHSGSIKLGPNVLNKLTTQGEMGKLDPPMVPQVDRDIATMIQMMNVLNKNPEVRQGQVDTKGAYNSAKTMEELAQALDTTFDHYWDHINIGMEHLMACAFGMDEQLWPREEKRITTNIKGQTYRDAYIPAVDIAGRRDIRVDPSFGGGGYQGFLMNIQAQAAKVIPRRDVVESMPGVQDADQKMREVDLESLEDLQKANLGAQAATGQMDSMFVMDLYERVSKGDDFMSAFKKLREAAQQQSQQAMETGATMPVTNPPPGAEPAPEAGPPGLNPAMLV